jgi:hypothetical protein
MQMLRRCLPIIGYFAELQERHAMTQTSKHGINSEHSEGERTRGNGVVAEVPEFWIIDDELWQAVKTRQREIADKYVNVTEAIREAQSNRPHGLRPPKALFSGLIHCGVCGGPCSLCGQDRYACSARVTNSSCANARTIARTDFQQACTCRVRGSDGAGDRGRGDARLRRGDESARPRAPRQRRWSSLGTQKLSMKLSLNSRRSIEYRAIMDVHAQSHYLYRKSKPERIANEVRQGYCGSRLVSFCSRFCWSPTSEGLRPAPKLHGRQCTKPCARISDSLTSRWLIMRSRWDLRIPRSVLMAWLPIGDLSKTSPSCAALQRSLPSRRQSRPLYVPIRILSPIPGIGAAEPAPIADMPQHRLEALPVAEREMISTIYEISKRSWIPLKSTPHHLGSRK